MKKVTANIILFFFDMPELGHCGQRRARVSGKADIRRRRA